MTHLQFISYELCAYLEILMLIANTMKSALDAADRLILPDDTNVHSSQQSLRCFTLKTL